MSYRNGNGVAGERVYLSQLYARILDDVEQGRDVLWMFPRGADVAEHMGNLYRLAAHYLRVEMIDEPRWRPVAVEGSPDGSPLRVQLALGAHGGDDSEAAADLWLMGPGAVPSPPEWGDGGPPRPGRARPVTIEIQPPPGRRPPVIIPVYASQWPPRVPGSVHLSIRRLWGCTGWGDMYQLATALLGDGEEVAYTMWATSVWVELAGPDEALLRELIEQRVPPATWKAFLEEYAARRGWQGETLSMAQELLRRALPGHTLSLTHPDQPSAWLWGLWAEGMVDLLRGRGVEVHSAVLAALKWDRLLYHRIWRGQLRNLFPLIDQARLLVAQERAQRAIGQDPWGSVDGIDAELADEWSCPPSLRDVVSDLRRARNSLAHYEPLDWDAYRSVVAALNSLQRHLSAARMMQAAP